MAFLGRFESFAGEQVPGSIVGDSEGIAILFVAEFEFTFVIRAPELIGRFGIG